MHLYLFGRALLDSPVAPKALEVGGATHDTTEGEAAEPTCSLAGPTGGFTGGSMNIHGQDVRSATEGRRGAERMQAPLSPAEKSRLDQLCASTLARQAVLKQIQEVSERAGLAGFEVVRAGAISKANGEWGLFAVCPPIVVKQVYTDTSYM